MRIFRDPNIITICSTAFSVYPNDLSRFLSILLLLIPPFLKHLACRNLLHLQVKRKRKEHRSLDSILFEDDGELEYFDVLNLLPLSNVRLEFDEGDARNNNFAQRSNSSRASSNSKPIECLESQVVEERSTRSNVTDEEKCKVSSVKEGSSSQDSQEEVDYQQKEFESSQGIREDSSPEQSKEKSCRDVHEDFEDDRNSIHCLRNVAVDREPLGTRSGEDKYKLDEELADSRDEQIDRKVEEVEDYKSIWISDSEEQEDMSRRPQVLRVVDSDVTKRKYRPLSDEIDPVAREGQKDEECKHNGKKSHGRMDTIRSNRKIRDANRRMENAEVNIEREKG